ncbi:MAG: SGNH/GDSL hydrolase family protein [Nocardioidaceae bacterium]|nr:SGNH/GDSL hydrolase family protein [Nocardioidaceae bacterium]MCL2613461.1 SGNH/GDSL hydrolase family protein [Nocardioidaceae bacterium]
MTSGYLRFAALGDSTTVGVGDRIQGGGWRGWARLLAESLSASYDVSFCNLAISGATTTVVREQQLAAAVTHRPDLASLVVGINDTLRSTWDPVRVRDDLFAIGGRLAAEGATLVTLRFHDHGELLGLPGFLRRPLRQRIDQVNAAYDDLHAAYGGVRLDLGGRAELTRRDCWSVDRFHPSEIGHRALAIAVAGALGEAGWDVVPPGAAPDGGMPRTWRSDAVWMLAEGAPWVGRRARDLGPWAVRRAVAAAR